MNIVRTLLITLLACGALSLIGCGDSGGDGGDGGGGDGGGGGGTAEACQNYVDATEGCYEEAGVDSVLPEDYCDSFTVDVQASTDLLNCYAEQVAGVDCSDPANLGSIDLTACN